jgi:methylmalonyl-CoA/ethylmalonyl-CoA epimerase
MRASARVSSERDAMLESLRSWKYAPRGTREGTISLTARNAEDMASIAATWRPQGSFHHVGFVVSSIEQVVAGFAKSLDARWDGVIVHDPLQKVRVTFLQSANPADPLFELIEPAAEDSPVHDFARKGGGMHHVCYVVESLDEQLEKCRSLGGLLVSRPSPAPAFGGRRIAWVYTRNKLLIEYLEQ